MTSEPTGNGSPHLGHEIRFAGLEAGILVPKFYDPQLAADVAFLRSGYLTTTLGQLAEDGEVEIRPGHEVGKLAYGTGNIPFVRTSDLANWEIKADPKHSVSKAVFDEFATKQDVKPGDILLVRDGTYLIGSVAFVTIDDTPMLYQSHLLRIRVRQHSSISPYVLLAALQAPIVQRQFRARQFTADIIDSLGNRYLDVMLPIPSDDALRASIRRRVQEVVESRANLRRELQTIRDYPEWKQPVRARRTGGGNEDFWHGFSIARSSVDDTILIPKYYDPSVDERLRHVGRTHELISIGQLVSDGVVECSTGCEVGKMAYGTGLIPFVRSSDLSNLEIKHDPKHAVSEDIWNRHRGSADLRELDILFVRDGTYLVGQSAMAMESDLPALFAGGLYRFRVVDTNKLDPFLLLAALQTNVVRRQVQARRFTRDIIDTVGRRVFDVKVPLPIDKLTRERVSDRTRSAIERRSSLRRLVKSLPEEFLVT